MSAAGLNEDAKGWVYVPPVAGVHTVILGKLSFVSSDTKLLHTFIDSIQACVAVLWVPIYAHAL